MTFIEIYKSFKLLVVHLTWFIYSIDLITSQCRLLWVEEKNVSIEIWLIFMKATINFVNGITCESWNICTYIVCKKEPMQSLPQKYCPISSYFNNNQCIYNKFRVFIRIYFKIFWMSFKSKTCKSRPIGIHADKCCHFVR